MSTANKFEICIPIILINSLIILFLEFCFFLIVLKTLNVFLSNYKTIKGLIMALAIAE